MTSFVSIPVELSFTVCYNQLSVRSYIKSVDFGVLAKTPIFVEVWSLNSYNIELYRYYRI
ncbi:hypothetical protein [Dapis sp. BLCC M126]|uniref:hypothetical protein n=1 Tax=Dapis sp. BLCC M126 TaxID=3400189 RepID=UPI003CFA2EAF